MLFILTLCCLIITAATLFNHSKNTDLSPKEVQFNKLQKQFLAVYFLATFSDWLQGPYVYKVYSDYGYNEEDIATLYITGFISSFIFGVIVGYVADKHGRKFLCILFGFTYSACCITKLSRKFYILLLGRVLGGISTSIFYSTFEAWYVNEHLNHLNFPAEWLNITFSKSTFYSGLLAILAGMISHLFVEIFNFSAVFPFLLAIPFLLASSYLISVSWKEHFQSQSTSSKSIFTPLYMILIEDWTLLILGFINSVFEAAMYIFIFSYTPILSKLNPPLGIVFSCFMITYMIGSKLYSLSLTYRIPPQLTLVLTCGVAFLCFSVITFLMFYYLSDSKLHFMLRKGITQICFVCFLVFECSIGVYFPAIGYLRGRVIPEDCRTSITNWFRVPMNLFICFSLTLNRNNKYDSTDLSPSVLVFKKLYNVYLLCSVFLLFITLASLVFQQKYAKKYCPEELTKTLNDEETV